MNTLVLETDPLATGVSVTDEDLKVDMTDGRRLIVPLAWYPRLWHASASERRNWRLLGDGYAIEWPDLDEHIGVEGMLAGRRSGESQRSLDHWLKARCAGAKRGRKTMRSGRTENIEKLQGSMKDGGKALRTSNAASSTH